MKAGTYVTLVAGLRPSFDAKRGKGTTNMIILRWCHRAGDIQVVLKVYGDSSKPLCSSRRMAGSEVSCTKGKRKPSG
eukprot:4214698-Amphidinium_carterae.1